ncbi:hypothetical protein HDV06_004903 [Boothiomyces sp. JEL0866]|nr:hypothetical protein HDV06_004903 [Boothiomyces sp. JEL0866]
MGEVTESVFSTDVHGHIAFGIDLTAGIFGGSAGVLAGHPLDTIKVRLQAPGQRYGVVGCFSQIVRNEGVTGLYKGMASPIVGVAVINSLLFGVYGAALRLVSDDVEKPTVTNIFTAGSLWLIIVKIRLQNQSNNPSQAGISNYKGPIDCIKQIYRAKGVPGLFKGLPTTIMRETPSYGAYFASYELMCRMIPDVNPNEPSPGLLLAGGFAGIIGWLSTYPIDVVKTRLQSIEEERKPKYKNMINGLRVIAREEGVRVLFSGLGATAIRAFPTNAATFYVVVTVRNMLNQAFGESD